MARSISSGVGRIWIMSLIAVFFVGSFLTLHIVFGGGAIGSENQFNAILKIVGFYVPLLTLIATFYFTENLGGMSSDHPSRGIYRCHCHSLNLGSDSCNAFLIRVLY